MPDPPRPVRFSAADLDCAPRDAWGLVAAQVGRGPINNDDAVGWVLGSRAWAVTAETSTPAWRLRESSQDGITP